MKDFAFDRALPWIVVGMAACFLFFTMASTGTAPDKMDLESAGKIPVVDGGRVKPLDTVARTTLMIISHRQTFTDDKDQPQPAMRWLLDVMAKPRTALHYKVFRIENDQVLSMLGLEARPGSYRYAVDEFADKLNLIHQRAEAALELKPDRRDIFQDKIIELDKHVKMYLLLSTGKAPLMVPPSHTDDGWQSMAQAQESDPTAVVLDKLLSAYSHDDARTFNKLLADYQKKVEAQLPAESDRTGFEVFFNRFQPFYQCTLLYVVVFLLTCFSWFGWTEPLNRSAFWLALLTVVVHTWALLARMYLMDRWFVFVTNLYSSAVFIGLGCVLLCLILEFLFHNGIGNVVGSVLGAVTLLIAHHLGSSGDTLEMMQAVLDTNFWLATHVTCVTLGYMATFVAGALGIVYLIRGVLTPSLDKSDAKALTAMLYAVVCFATLLSFTGTVLGGIWADQSWGRFWGWDPKENGAMLIVIWNALILHARWGGMVKGRGMAVLAVVGNMVTGWSWFGTNQLQVGLHSYGFSNTLAVGLVVGWALHAAVLVMGMLPLRWWASYQALTTGRVPQVEEAPQPAPQPAKRRGKRGRRGETGFFPGPA